MAKISTTFSASLITWQQKHGRHDLPWQNTSDPYRIWLSEIMLQQTQVATVIPYYHNFLAHFPTVEALARASQAAVLGQWAGLGYYARARNLHKAAERIVQDYKGAFPQTEEGLAKLPGIGPSTAAAIAAFAFGQKAAILDGNVKRVLARVFGVTDIIDAPKTHQALLMLAKSLLPPKNIQIYTQALMDFGALLCTKNAPKCTSCPFEETCLARAQGLETILPYRKAKTLRPEKHADFLLLTHEGKIFLAQQAETGIWGGLWALPLFDPKAPETFFQAHGLLFHAPEKMQTIKHSFTHFHLHMSFWKASLAKTHEALAHPRFAWHPLKKINSLGMPAPIKRFLQAAL